MTEVLITIPKSPRTRKRSSRTNGTRLQKDYDGSNEYVIFPSSQARSSLAAALKRERTK